MKTQTRTPIPAGLLKFLQDVDQQIQAGDEAMLIESDDLIQAHTASGGPCVVYGGLFDKQAGMFGFRYFHDEVGEVDDEDPPTWDFHLSRDEIRCIATGEVAHLELWKCESPQCECLHATSDSYCFECREGGDAMRDLDSATIEQYSAEGQAIVDLMGTFADRINRLTPNSEPDAKTTAQQLTNAFGEAAPLKPEQASEISGDLEKLLARWANFLHKRSDDSV